MNNKIILEQFLKGIDLNIPGIEPDGNGHYHSIPMAPLSESPYKTDEILRKVRGLKFPLRILLPRKVEDICTIEQRDTVLKIALGRALRLDRDALKDINPEEKEQSLALWFPGFVGLTSFIDLLNSHPIVNEAIETAEKEFIQALEALKEKPIYEENIDALVSYLCEPCSEKWVYENSSKYKELQRFLDDILTLAYYQNKQPWSY